MYSGLDLSPDIDFPSPSVWNSVIPSKIIFFTWEASWGKVITLDQFNLANRCCLCEEDEETIDHLLIHCKIVRMLWDLFLTIVGTSWVFPHSVLHTLSAWQGAPVGKKRKKSGWLLLNVFSGLYGGKEIGWCLITGSPMLKK